MPKWSSTKIRNQEVHTNGPVLDDVLLADSEVNASVSLLSTTELNASVGNGKLKCKRLLNLTDSRGNSRREEHSKDCKDL